MKTKLEYQKEQAKDIIIRLIGYDHDTPEQLDERLFDVLNMAEAAVYNDPNGNDVEMMDDNGPSHEI